MADWQKIKTEYITTDTSYRKLAEKYGVNYRVIGDKGKAEDWPGLRAQHKDSVLTQTLGKISSQAATRAAKIENVADKLLTKIEAKVDAVKPEYAEAKDLRALAAAIRELKEIHNVRGDLDLQEQEARIAKLRKEAAGEDEKQAPVLEIRGLPEEYTV